MDTKLFKHRKKYLINRFFYVLKNEGIIVFLKKIYKTIFYSNKIDLDKMHIDKNLGLDDIFLKFGTDKGSLDGKKTYDQLKKTELGRNKFKNYLDWINRDNPKNFSYQLGNNFTPYYEKYFGHLRHKNLKILEIGIGNGHSIASWSFYFPNSEIHAADIKKNYYFFYKSERINFHTLDCLDERAVNKFVNKNKNFDIIIDDSLHVYEVFMKNIKNFYPILNPGGIYILEDFRSPDREIELETKYNEEMGGTMMGKTPTMRKVFECIKKKEMFESNILKEKNLKYIFNTIKNVEVSYLDHPGAALGVLFKKS